MEAVTQEELITIEEVMKILKIGKNTAYQLLEDKEIEAFRIGNKWKIPRSSVYKYIQAQTHNVK
ncbi:helix-turn-helix domain-containing protein [Ruminococcus flavefaciens]|uniref:DNA binding domain-containing protein, excisionase family n=1 Tax=Ruminococcus flavefaciens TaxID=1265 RepID=A0A1K1MFG1_RUMFL|nr:helix-turn-helix domain-containing protein [Ruminococcus flavefaciens]SFW21825.1 DNA binding domain-containing protein, excisionase family [Ruminococcus flavefaciens]